MSDKKTNTLLRIFREEKAAKYSGGIYHKTQIDLTYNSNHMEGSRLTHDQTRYIFETSDSGKDWFAVGNYKRRPNEVGGMATALPEEVPERMRALLAQYHSIEDKTLEDILEFHVRFERIHPFQDGNGRVGRLIMFKECLNYGIVPFMIEDDLKLFYYRGLKEWDNEKGYLTDTCLTAQDRYQAYLDYFRIDVT